MSDMRSMKGDKETTMLRTRVNFYLPAILLFTVVLLTFLAYYRSLSGPLIFDDVIYISSSHLKNIARYLSLSFRSVANLSFALNYYLSGLSVEGFRITNIIFHVVSVFLVFYLTYTTLNLPAMRDKYGKSEDRRMPLYIALFTATLFSLHPIQTSAVNYITQRMAIMAGLFSFAGIIFYAKGAITSGKKYMYYYSMSVLFFILAIFSKENAVMVLPALMLYDFVFISSFRWSEFRKRFIPIVVLGMIIGLTAAYYLNAGRLMKEIMTLFSNPYQPMGTYGWSGAEIHWTPLEYILTELRVVSQYIFLILLPLPSYMVFDYSSAYRVSTDLFHPITTLLSFFFLVTIFILAIRYLKKIPLISFGILWYLITISLESFVALGLDPYFEHRNYLPGYGLFLAVASLFLYMDKLRVGIKKETIILSVALLLFVLTFARNGAWRDGTLLWADTVTKSPDNIRARVNLGIAYSEKGLVDEAIREFQDALRVRHDSAEAHFNLGIAYAKKGLAEKAIEEYTTTLKLRPSHADSHIYMGLAYFEKGETDQAIEEYKIALKMKPRKVKAHVNLGIAYGSKGLMDKAIEHFLAAIEINPELAEAHNNLGIAYAKTGSIDKAIEQFQIAVDLQPDYQSARNNLRALRQGRIY
jgi:protein O-mannosyl-transferase